MYSSPLLYFHVPVPCLSHRARTKRARLNLTVSVHDDGVLERPVVAFAVGEEKRALARQLVVLRACTADELGRGSARERAPTFQVPISTASGSALALRDGKYMRPSPWRRPALDVIIDAAPPCARTALEGTLERHPARVHKRAASVGPAIHNVACITDRRAPKRCSGSWRLHGVAGRGGRGGRAPVKLREPGEAGAARSRRESSQSSPDGRRAVSTNASRPSRRDLEACSSLSCRLCVHAGRGERTAAETGVLREYAMG